MSQATRTTKLLDLGRRDQGGANLQKRAALDATAEVLTAARAFYIDFFLAHAGKLAERVISYSEEHLEMRERLISAHEPPLPGWNFTQRFPGMPFAYRRSVIKDAIGKVRSYLSNHANWEKSGKKQWQSGRPVKGEHSNQQLWRHVDRLNDDAAHKVARRIAQVCANYPGCILLFERLRQIKPGKGSRSRRMNRRRANQLRGKINQQAKDKAYLHQAVTVEVNAHGTSQYCSRCS